MVTCKIIEFPAPQPKITTVADLLAAIEVRCSAWMIIAQDHVACVAASARRPEVCPRVWALRIEDVN